MEFADDEQHTLMLYERDEYLFDTVADFLSAGLRTGEWALALLTRPHRDALVRRLETRGVAIDTALASGQLTLLDAEEALSSIALDTPHAQERFFTLLDRHIRREPANEQSGRQKIRVFGELASLLCQRKQVDAAIQMEAWWDDLAHIHPFSLLCAYSLDHFADPGLNEPFKRICKAHSRVIPAESYSHFANEETQLREVALLQQRAHALEAETERRLGAEIATRQALAVRDEFLSMASHELKTPLTVLDLQVQALLIQFDDLSSNDPVNDSGAPGENTDYERECLRRLGRSVDRLHSLIEKLLDVAHISSGQFGLMQEPIDLIELARHMVERLGKRAAQVCLSVDANAHPLEGHWDRRRLAQVLENLLSNALKYGEDKPVDVTLTRTEKWARLTVRDRGIGISAPDQARIFERYHRASAPHNFDGLGLSLWMARRIVEAHGGTIRVESQPGQGASFVVELPLGE
jgi:signal transduction histidine kinase